MKILDKSSNTVSSNRALSVIKSPFSASTALSSDDFRITLFARFQNSLVPNFVFVRVRVLLFNL